MELLLLVSLYLLTFIGKSLGDEKELFATEDSDIILPCSSFGNVSLTHQLFDWKKKDTPKYQEVFLYDNGSHYNNGKLGQNKNFINRVEFFQDKLQFGNASIRIKNTKLTDAGDYECIFPRLQPPGWKVYIKLVVGYILKDRTGEKINGSFGKPSVQRLNIHKDWALLKCEVLGAYPKPTLVWHDNAGRKISDKEPQCTKKEDRYDMTLNITVTKTGAYTCIASQEEIHHQSNKTTSVYIGDEDAGKSETTSAFVVVVVVVVVVVAIVGVILYRKKQNTVL